MSDLSQAIEVCRRAALEDGRTFAGVAEEIRALPGGTAALEEFGMLVMEGEK